jgi:DNA-directed RNA polymerase subunit A'
MVSGLSKRIEFLQFALLSPDEIRRMSAVKVITADTYDDDGYPIEMGLMDMHLGVIEPNLRCRTCGGRVNECPGHFGIIELAMPVIHAGYAKEIKRLLQATCRACGRLLSDTAAAKAASGLVSDEGTTLPAPSPRSQEERRCPYCHEVQPRITLDKPTTFRENGHKITPKEVRARLERIPDDSMVSLGLNPAFGRPEWMVLTVLPVPPISVRPSITLESGERSEDDLTHKLVDVLRINQRLRENRDLGAPQLVVEDLWELLQYHVTTYIDNQTSGIPPARHRSGRPLKTLVQRLKGKDGRFRSNLSGKRVNFSARTVISPDPYLSINEVGIPWEVARALTVPLVVTSYNVDAAKEFVKRGPNPPPANGRYLPGVNYVIREDGLRIKVMDKNTESVAEMVAPGCTVERQLMDGDIVLFNRQPSLHRMSMMAHFVRVLPYKTFRFNLCDCTPYNADFDGDEMNLHVIQSQEARAEAKVIMQVQEQILSPRYGGPIIGMIHDHITAAFLLTYKNPHFNRYETNYILSKVSIPTPPPAGHKKNGEPFWTGKQLFSLTLPKDLTIEFRSNICTHKSKDPKAHEEDDCLVQVEDGVLKAGTIDAKAIGQGKGVILDTITRNYGPIVARDFLDTMSRLAITAMGLFGLSTGIDDEDVSEQAFKDITKALTKARKEVDDLVEQYRKGELEQMPGRSLEETLEVSVRKVLGAGRDSAGDIAGKQLGLDNPAVILAKSGARGSMLNLTQMAGAVGQQSVRGERLMRGYYDRTLPHFPRGELGAHARGFVSSNYKKGLTPTEYFFHSMGGREALVDTAVRTSRSGYMQRRLINAMEDVHVEDDGTVRNTAGAILQYRYGEDGVDPCRSIQGQSMVVEEVLEKVLGKRYRTYEGLVRGEGIEGTTPVDDQELDLLAEAQTEDEVEEEPQEEETPGGEDNVDLEE